MAGGDLFSVVIPVYRNEEFVPHLIREFSAVSSQALLSYGVATEFVFVVDGSPDRSYELLAEALPRAPFQSQLLHHARNFGSFAAVRTGMRAGAGDYLAVIAADLQEPPELLLRFLEVLLKGEHDVVVGTRESRADPAGSKAAANLFWAVYRRLVIPELPKGGVDILACTRRFRDELLSLNEANSSLIGQVFWLGFRRAEIPYSRRARAFGRSAWTFRKKLTYLLDSIFAFTDLPIRMLSFFGLLGLLVAGVLGLSIVMARVFGGLTVPGYAATATLVLFFGALNTLGLGLVGSYAWRAYENTKNRPLAVVDDEQTFAGTGLVRRPAELRELST